MLKNLPASAGDERSILGREDPLEEEMAMPSGILACEISMDRGAWQAIVQGVTKSETQLSNQTTATTTLTHAYSEVKSLSRVFVTPLTPGSSVHGIF